MTCRFRITASLCMIKFGLWITFEKSLYIAVHIPLEKSRAVDDALSRQLYAQAHARGRDDARSLACDPLQHWSGSHLSDADQPVIAREQLHIDVESIAGIQPASAKPMYMAAVQRIQAYISQGDVFQVNLSVRQSRQLCTTPEEIYEALRIVNPSPYMGLLRFAGFALVSGSPELPAQLEDGVLRTRPIAGTRPRGKDEQDDLRLAGELYRQRQRARRARHAGRSRAQRPWPHLEVRLRPM